MSWVHAGSGGMEGLVTIVVIAFWVVSRILGAAVKKGGPSPMPRSMPPTSEPSPPPGPSPEDELRRFLEDLTGAELPPQAPPPAPPPVAEPTEAEPVAEAPMPPPAQLRKRRHRRSTFVPPAIPAPTPAPVQPAARWYEEAAPGGVTASPPATVLPRPRVSLNAFSIPGIKLPSLRWGSVGSQSTGNAAAGADAGRRQRGLNCPGGLRHAMVLRTILGPPRALAEVRPDGSHDD